MPVFNPGYYVVNRQGSEGTLFETITGDLQAFDNAATQAVENSRRDTSHAFAVFYRPWVTPGMEHEDIVRIGYAIAGQWFWRGQGIA